MKYNLTQEQFLTYIYGLEKTQKIQEDPEKNHYVQAFEKLQNGKKFVWNWAPFFIPIPWSVYRRIPHIGLLSTIFFAIILLITALSTSFAGPATLITAVGICASLMAISNGGFANYFLIKYISKQIKKGNICPFPNGAPLTLSIFSAIIPLLSLVAILYNKYIISRYRKAKKQES